MRGFFLAFFKKARLTSLFEKRLGEKLQQGFAAKVESVAKTSFVKVFCGLGGLFYKKAPKKSPGENFNKASPQKSKARQNIVCAEFLP